MNYSYAQMKKMQQEAFERVKEMQRRADLTARQAMQEMNAQKEPPLRIPDEPKRVKMPVEFPEKEEKISRPAGGDWLHRLTEMSDDERENALLLTLLSLLGSEGADKELLFALLYILG